MKIDYRQVSEQEAKKMLEAAPKRIKTQPGGASITSAMEGIYPVYEEAGASQKLADIGYRVRKGARVKLLKEHEEGCWYSDDLKVRLPGGTIGEVKSTQPFRLVGEK